MILGSFVISELFCLLGWSTWTLRDQRPWHVITWTHDRFLGWVMNFLRPKAQRSIYERWGPCPMNWSILVRIGTTMNPDFKLLQYITHSYIQSFTFAPILYIYTSMKFSEKVMAIRFSLLLSGIFTKISFVIKIFFHQKEFSS